MLLSALVLKAPDFEKPFKLQVDANDVGIGAVLLQESPQGIDHLVSYYSQKFNNQQANYSTSEKQAFAVLSVLQHFDVLDAIPCDALRHEESPYYLPVDDQ